MVDKIELIYLARYKKYLRLSVLIICEVTNQKICEVRESNPEICLQVEEIHGPLHWRSVIVNGRASRLTEHSEIDHAMHLIKERNTTLSPAINRTWIDADGRSEAIAIYRIHESEISGRTTDGVSSQ
ncbi:MAG: pyridoxamine 5'-phosphate oxidase family protein [Nostoc sp.]|uniref:pyridoxamine 5'-phosphate oxidase family protein n=1 Tax=Nostoc sp. TaxID=1180 RepID=UPI002FFBDE63